MQTFKERLFGALGTFGSILYYILAVCLTFCPLSALGFPFWLKLILIMVVTTIPFIGPACELVLWVWSFFIMIHAPLQAFTIFYFIACAVYVFTKPLPFLLNLFSSKSK